MAFLYLRVHFLARREIRTNKYISLQFPQEMNNRGRKTLMPFIPFHTTLQSYNEKSLIFAQLFEEYHVMTSKRY